MNRFHPWSFGPIRTCCPMPCGSCGSCGSCGPGSSHHCSSFCFAFDLHKEPPQIQRETSTRLLLSRCIKHVLPFGFGVSLSPFSGFFFPVVLVSTNCHKIDKKCEIPRTIITYQWCNGPRHANDMHHTPLLPVPVAESEFSCQMPQWSSDPVIFPWPSSSSFSSSWVPGTVATASKWKWQIEHQLLFLRRTIMPTVHCGTVHAEIYWNSRHSTAFHDLLSFFIPTFIPLLGCNKKSTSAHMRSTGNEPDRVRHDGCSLQYRHFNLKPGVLFCVSPWVPSPSLLLLRSSKTSYVWPICWRPKNHSVTLAGCQAFQRKRRLLTGPVHAKNLHLPHTSYCKAAEKSLRNGGAKCQCPEIRSQL